jgi:copper chaperone CopZ
MDTYTFKLTGLHCEACVKLSTMALQKIEGISNVKINLDTGLTTVDSTSHIDQKRLEEVFRDTDYTPTLL